MLHLVAHLGILVLGPFVLAFVSFVLLASTLVDGQPLMAELSTFLFTRKDAMTGGDMYGVLALTSIGISLLMHTVIVTYWVTRRAMFGRVQRAR